MARYPVLDPMIPPERWPRRANISQWARILGVSAQTIQAKRKKGKLGDGRWTLHKSRTFSRDEIIAAFDIHL
jgi:hypothetical protein